MKYYDKNGSEIQNGFIIQHDDGEEQLVYACGDDDLGINASNEEFLKNHPEQARQYYPLYQFNLKQWTIVNKGE